MRRLISSIVPLLVLMMLSLMPAYGQSDTDEYQVSRPMAAAVPDQGVAPTRIVIAALGLDTDVIPVGTDQYGAMAAPDDPDAVAWYSLGPGLAPIGNVVLAGHVDWDGQLRAFGRLESLSEGDEISLWNDDGQVFSYLVDSSDWVNADGASVDEIFGQSMDARITLITCGGLFDPFHRQYLQRLIVRAHATTS